MNARAPWSWSLRKQRGSVVTGRVLKITQVKACAGQYAADGPLGVQVGR